jgi:hypothetical protein
MGGGVAGWLGCLLKSRVYTDIFNLGLLTVLITPALSYFLYTDSLTVTRHNIEFNCDTYDLHRQIYFFGNKSQLQYSRTHFPCIKALGVDMLRGLGATRQIRVEFGG